MTPEDQAILALAQKIYLARNGEENDDTDEDLTAFIDQTINWVNQFIRELEVETDWNFSRTNNNTIATIQNTTDFSFDLPEGVRKLVFNSQRDLTIRQDGTVVSSFKLVNPNQISDPTDTWDTRPRATVLNNKVILSRPPLDTEVGGIITADTIDWLPDLTHEDVTLLDIVKPQELLVLGVLKNQVLSDIVQRGLTPTFTQKYNDLLQKCIAQNNESADADNADMENFGFVRGIW